MVDVYSDIAEFGKIAANIRLIIAAIVSFILIVAGIVILTLPVKRNEKVEGTITSTNCVEKTITENNVQKKDYECDITVKYTIDGKDISSNIKQTTTTPYSINQLINLYYDPNNITDIDVFSDNYRIWGWISFGLAIIIVVGAGIWAFVVHKSKFAAAAGGGAETVGLISNMFRGFGR